MLNRCLKTAYSGYHYSPCFVNSYFSFFCILCKPLRYCRKSAILNIYYIKICKEKRRCRLAYQDSRQSAGTRRIGKRKHFRYDRTPCRDTGHSSSSHRFTQPDASENHYRDPDPALFIQHADPDRGRSDSDRNVPFQKYAGGSSSHLLQDIRRYP